LAPKTNVGNCQSKTLQKLDKLPFAHQCPSDRHKLTYATDNDNLLWLFVIADHVRYIVYAVITDDCRRPDLGFTVTTQLAPSQ